MSPALAGGFFTTESPGKPCIEVFNFDVIYLFLLFERLVSYPINPCQIPYHEAFLCIFF